jgi:hypothetical protein
VIGDASDRLMKFPGKECSSAQIFGLRYEFATFFWHSWGYAEKNIEVMFMRMPKLLPQCL